MSDAGECPSDKTKVFFDGSCPLCIAEINHYRKLDDGTALDFVDVSNGDAALPAGLSPDAAMARFHVQTSDGQIRSGAEAFTQLWTQVPGWRWLAPVRHVPGALWVLERLYRLFLKVRPRVQRWMRRRAT